MANGAKASVTAFDWFGLIMISFILPAILCYVFGVLFIKALIIKDGDLKLDI